MTGQVIYYGLYIVMHVEFLVQTLEAIITNLCLWKTSIGMNMCIF